jgi:hypothetical protein
MLFPSLRTLRASQTRLSTILESSKIVPCPEAWLSMKNEHLMLALIVPGRRQVKNMDVYLQPLVDELKELWEGIHVYDVSRPITTERSFTLYGICAYTTHDYPGLGVFSGN